jgi:hypothetical protein
MGYKRKRGEARSSEVPKRIYTIDLGGEVFTIGFDQGWINW